MKRLAAALMALFVAATIAPAGAAGQASGEAYAGTHVSFDAAGQAVTDYAVDGETMLSSVAVQSQSDAESGGLADVGASVSAVTSLQGAGLDIAAESDARARVEADGGATLTAHDNERGILVVASGDRSDYVVANLSTGADASAESDAQVEVTTANGTEGTFLVVGGGNVTVNDDGGVTAHLAEDGRLVFRSYPDGKDEADDEQERLVAEGAAAGETYVTAGENGTVVDTVSYDDNTTLAANRTAEGVEIAVDRATHEGTVLLTSVSEEALDATDDLEVTVDGEAAVEAATYTQLESAVGSERSRYLVESTANGSADVLVAVDHFSERTVAMHSGDSADATTTAATTDGSTATSASGAPTDGATTAATGTTAETTEDDSSGTVPGFTAGTAAVALAAAALVARLR